MTYSSSGNSGVTNEFEALLAGPHGTKARALLGYLQTMSLYHGPRLIELVRAGNWHRTDPDVRFEILSLVNIAITALRDRQMARRHSTTASRPTTSRPFSS